LLGPPGSGKGTQAKLLCERRRLVHVGTGDILREAARVGTPAGKLAEPYIRLGKLVPDDLVNDLINERFRQADRPDSFVMDGYPRTLAQAHAFDVVLRQQHLNLDHVIFVAVADDLIVQRMSGRWSCPKCKATYHLVNNPPKRPGVCDECGTALFQRPDDMEETVRERLRQYHQNTVDLIPHYQSQGLLRNVNGEGGIEAIYGRIERVLDQ
ncbi:MAG TPA: adenylate kinase, partial [Gemmataceae bacterium]|nr:adenylate kinase [Gemmataceae bacterium]